MRRVAGSVARAGVAADFFIVVALAGCVAEESFTTGHSATSEATTGGVTTELEMFDYEGEHVVVKADPGLELCGGSMRHMDDFVARVSGEFGVEPPAGDDLFRFYWLTDKEEVGAQCGGLDVDGCAKGDVIYAIRAPLNHELVHSVTFKLGVPSPFFLEGAARAHEGLHGVIYTPGAGLTENILDVMEFSTGMLADPAAGYYDLAGAFSAYLIDVHGFEDYLRVYTAIPRDADREVLDRTFKEVLGVSLVDSIAQFDADHWQYCRNEAYDAKLMECAAPELAWDGQLLAMGREVACDQEDVVGPYNGQGVVAYTITIPTEGRYELRMVGDVQESTNIPDLWYNGTSPRRGVSLRACGGCPGTASMETIVGGTPRHAPLQPGLYTLRLHAPIGEPEVGFTLRRLPEPVDPGGVLDGWP